MKKHLATLAVCMIASVYRLQQQEVNNLLKTTYFTNKK